MTGNWRGLVWGMVSTLVFVGGGLVCADEVVLSNGDVLHGRVLSAAGGKVEFESGPLGVLQIAAEEILELRTEGEVCVIAAEGEPAWYSRLEAAGDPNRVLLSDAEVEYGMALTEVYAVGAAAEALLVSPEDVWKWTGEAEAGLSGRSGNTDRAATSGRVTVEGKNSRWSLSGWARGLYAVQERNGEEFVTDNEAMGGGKVMRRLGEGFSAYVRGEAERDKVEQLRLRALLNGGLSLAWFEDERLVVANRAGLGKQEEWYEGGDKQMYVAGELAGEARYKLNSRVELSHETVWVMDVDSCERYQLSSESAATVYLDNHKHFYLKSGLTHKYDSDVPEGVEELDTYYFTNVGYRW